MSKDKSLWEQFTEWSFTTVKPQIDQYADKVPHLSEGLREGLAKVVVFLFKLAVILVIIALVPAPFYLFGGLHGLLLIVYMAFWAYGAWSSRRSISDFSQKGWEYLFALTILGYVYNLATLALSIFASPTAIFAGLINFAIQAAIGLYILYEIKPVFNKEAALAKEAKQAKEKK